jgi:UPF0755 protein
MANSKRRRHSLFLLIAVLIVLVGCVGLVFGYLYVTTEVADTFGKPSSNLTFTQRIVYPIELFINRDKMNSSRESASSEREFIVDQGESVSMVCIRLEQDHLIEDAELFRIYLVYSGLDRQLQSGVYQLSPAMTPLEIAADLLDATPKDAIVTILPGWRIEEIAGNVAGSGLEITEDDFIALAYAPLPEFFDYLPVSEAPSLEGFLFPGTYDIPRESNLITVIETLLSGFSSSVTQDMLDGFARQGLSINEAVTLASIVEKEAVLDEEKPMITSVFYNRIANGMRLETDPTVQYALGFQVESSSWWKSPLSSEDLVIDSSYNTYLYAGLPPTPIANPDLASLQAVAFPAETPYFYFRAACDDSGRHNFSITYEEHLNNTCE